MKFNLQLHKPVALNIFTVTFANTAGVADVSSLEFLLKQHMTTKRWNKKIAYINLTAPVEIYDSVSNTKVTLEHDEKPITYSTPLIAELSNGNIAGCRSYTIMIFDHVSLAQIQTITCREKVSCFCPLHGNLLLCGTLKADIFLYDVV
jgi:hypothetical protein